MNDFVNECRGEWRRLRVPDRVADEMAAELAADLAEAAEEGVPQDDVIGSALSDPRSFAASWAAERGFARPSSRGQVARKAVLSGAIAGLAAVAVSGAVLMIAASSSSSGTRQAFAPRFAQSAKTVWIATTPGSTAAVAPPPLWVGQETSTSSSNRTVGLVLLIVGLAGVMPLAMFAVRDVNPRRTMEA